MIGLPAKFVFSPDWTKGSTNHGATSWLIEPTVPSGLNESMAAVPTIAAAAPVSVLPRKSLASCWPAM